MPTQAERPDYTVCAYYFPSYHVDPRNEAIHGPGWTEWELMRCAGPRFTGHAQPKTPLWGYEDESDPAVFGRKIDAAAGHGIDCFIFDWYWYDDGPFLERGLERGFLGASNAHRLKFALMWANHDWVNIHPAGFAGRPSLLYPGAVTRATFDTLAEYVIRHYFGHPSYWRIDGCPYFSIYELYRLIDGLGGVEATRDALEHFRARTQAAGFPDLHLNAVVWGVQILPGEQAINDPAALVTALGFASVTSYVWIHHVPLLDFPTTAYEQVMDAATAHWRHATAEFPLPYHPNVTMGWDASPRTLQSDRFANAGYPFMPVLEGNTPTAFKSALARARTFLDAQPGPKILSINAWNEWTEGSYLEPDTTTGMAYLEAVRDVFGP